MVFYPTNMIYLIIWLRYMASILLKVASEHSSIVAVVGKGHLAGIKKHWKQPLDVSFIKHVILAWLFCFFRKWLTLYPCTANKICYILSLCRWNIYLKFLLETPVNLRQRFWHPLVLLLLGLLSFLAFILLARGDLLK